METAENAVETTAAEAVQTAWEKIIATVLEADACYEGETSVSGKVNDGKELKGILDRYNYKVRILFEGKTFSEVMKALGGRDLLVKTQSYLKRMCVTEGMGYIRKTLGIASTKIVKNSKDENVTVHECAKILEIHIDDLEPEKKDRAPKDKVKGAISLWDKMSPEEREAFEQMLKARDAAAAGSK